MELIRQWLKGTRDYATGARLYRQFGKDPLLKRSFQEKETSFKRTQLAAAMQALIENARPVLHDDQVKAVAGEYVPVKTAVRQWNASNLTTDIERSLWAKYRLLAKEQADLHSRLESFPTDEKRKDAAFRILKIDDEMDDIIHDRDHFRQHGTLPDQDGPAYQTDPIKIGKRIETLTRYIRRERLALEKDPAHIKAAARLNTFIDELNHYNKQLGRDLYAV